MNLQERLAGDVLRDIDGWVTRVVERMRVDVPQLVSDETSSDLARTSSRALLEEFGTTLAAGSMSETYRAPAAARAFARHLARAGTPLSSLLRSYRLGQELLFSRAAKLAEAGDTMGLRDVGLLTFRFVDSVVGEVTEAFEQEREVALRGSVLRRERLVRRLLAGEDVGVAEAERVLGWRLGGSHLAIVCWSTEAEAESGVIAGILRRTIAWVGDGVPLTIQGTSGEMHAWVRPSEADRGLVPSDLLAVTAETGVRVAIGEPGEGLSGFINSRQQADAARRVTRFLPQRHVVHYADVALLHLLLADRRAASAFVRCELGPLADEEHLDLRFTARTYLELGQDTTATASALGLHRNTIMRRLARVEQLTGRSLRLRPAETLVATLLCEAALLYEVRSG